ncbi:MAG: hypothetical protein ACREFT_14860 [Acetobacteraceae bacterium]
MPLWSPNLRQDRLGGSRFEIAHSANASTAQAADRLVTPVRNAHEDQLCGALQPYWRERIALIGFHPIALPVPHLSGW